MVPRRRRRRYLIAASNLSTREKIEIDLNDWEQIWRLLDQFGEPVQPRFLYAIVDSGVGLVKIGKSVRPARRMKELRTGNGSELKLWAFCRHESPFTEREAHADLAMHRVSGEWFKLNAETTAYIQTMRKRAGQCDFG